MEPSQLSANSLSSHRTSGSRSAIIFTFGFTQTRPLRKLFFLPFFSLSRIVRTSCMWISTVDGALSFPKNNKGKKKFLKGDAERGDTLRQNHNNKQTQWQRLCRSYKRKNERLSEIRNYAEGKSLRSFRRIKILLSVTRKSSMGDNGESFA